MIKYRGDGTKKEFNRIIIPVDGSKSSKRNAKKALYLAKDIGVELYALYFLQDPDAIYPEMSSMYPDAIILMKKEAFAFLDEIKKMAREDDIKVQTKLVEGPPDEVLIKEGGKKDLIVLSGCKEKSELKEIVLGSLCQKMLHQSTSSIMILRE